MQKLTDISEEEVDQILSSGLLSEIELFSTYTKLEPRDPKLFAPN